MKPEARRLRTELFVNQSLYCIMISKEKLKKSLEEMPEEFSIEELIDKAMLLDKIERGNQQSIQNEVISEEQLEDEMKKWFK